MFNQNVYYLLKTDNKKHIIVEQNIDLFIWGKITQYKWKGTEFNLMKREMINQRSRGGQDSETIFCLSFVHTCTTYMTYFIVFKLICSIKSVSLTKNVVL